MYQTSELLSGIEIYQNVIGGWIDLDAVPLHQNFFIPRTIQRGGDANETRIPPLTGFSILLDVPESRIDTLTFRWKIERLRLGVGWVTQREEVHVGAPNFGKVWVDVYYEPINLDPEALTDNWRISLVGQTESISIAFGIVQGYTTAYRNDDFEDQINPSETAPLAFRVLTASGDEGRDFLGNTYRHSIFQHSIQNVGSDGDSANKHWLSKPNPSRFAVENLFFDVSENGSAGVVDSILLDPITPDVYFHVYYSSEGDPQTTSEAWNEKLWTRVERTFQATKRETHVFPEPIRARYIKIEFSHLQPRPYQPGPFQTPIRYQKHPKWVLDYHLLRLEQERMTANVSTARTVNLRYSALDIAYNYFLDDLSQEPQQPISLQGETGRLQEFVQTRTDRSDIIDSNLLGKINLSLQPFRSGTTSLVKRGSLLSEFVLATTTNVVPEEVPNLSRAFLNEVSTLNRGDVVVEQSFPVMSFYLTARHRYRELEAEFSHNRAYFAGVREIFLLRERYTKASDTNLYVEIGGDSVNLLSTDFVHDENALIIRDD
jgi:hypothetical protein